MGRHQLTWYEYYTRSFSPLSPKDTEQDGMSMRTGHFSHDTNSSRSSALREYSLARTTGKIRQYATISDDIFWPWYPIIMQKNIPNRQKWSALLVTMMITSVVLLFAMILLERIIPYSKQIRWMQDSVQAYYTARGEVEMAKLEFSNTRENIDTQNRIQDRGEEGISLSPPSLTSTTPGSYLIISEDDYLPLRIRLFAEDNLARSFGTSQKNSDFHTLGSGGGIFFDLSSRNTANYSMKIETDTENESTEADIAVEFVYSGTSVVPFFGNNTTPNTIHGKNIAETRQNTNSANSLADILGTNNCQSASCSLKIAITNTATSITSPVKFKISTAIPDLNAIIVADWISPNETYHSRIIELIPLVQGF